MPWTWKARQVCSRRRSSRAVSASRELASAEYCVRCYDWATADQLSVPTVSSVGESTFFISAGVARRVPVPDGGSIDVDAQRREIVQVIELLLLHFWLCHLGLPTLLLPLDYLWLLRTVCFRSFLEGSSSGLYGEH